MSKYSGRGHDVLWVGTVPGIPSIPHSHNWKKFVEINFSEKFPTLNFFHFAEFKWDVFLLMFSKHWISNHSFLSFSTFKPLNTDIWLERCEYRCLHVILRFFPLLFLCFLCYLLLPCRVPIPLPSGVEEKEWNCKATDFPKLGEKMKLKTLMTSEKFNFLIFKGFGTFSGKGDFFLLSSFMQFNFI